MSHSIHRSAIKRTWSGIVGRIVGSLALLALLPGCYTGISSNPFKFGNLPANDIVRTHAKPSLKGYYGNFDPAVCTLTVTPLESVNQVRKQHILIATVCDADGKARRNRRIEWHVTGVGHIVEVDESGFFSGRGYLVDDKYAVSYTNYKSHVLTRGNDDPSDDIELKPGQSWLVITSPEEGDTHVTCYAPGIYDWEKHKVFAVKHWIDAEPCFPQSAVNPTGQPHPMTTRITRSSDHSPVGGYLVRYRIIDGPPAVFEPGGAQQVDVISDPQGNASVTLRQTQATPGVNRIAIDVIRPGDKPTAKQILVGHHEMTKTWVAPQLAIQKLAPSTAVVGQQIPYQITVTNTGSVATRGITIRDTMPQGLQFVGSSPAATQQGADLIWSVGEVHPGQSVMVQFSATALAAGTVTNCAEAVMAEGIAGRSCATTVVNAAALDVSKTGPQTGLVGQPLNFQITVTNRGNAPATNVVVTDTFDVGFVHQTGSGPLQLQVGTLAPGESRQLPIILTARTTGRRCNQVAATADGGLTATAEHCVQIDQPQLSITKSGPAFAFVGARIEFSITVRNTGSLPATNIMVQDQVPPQLQLQQAEDGAVQGNIAIWNFGTLAPGQERTVRIMTLAMEVGPSVCNSATVSADGILGQQSPPACVNIKGVPALLTEVIDRADPVAVGGETTYTIQITNQGSVPANEVALSCLIPDGMEFVAAECDKSISYKQSGKEIAFDKFNGMAPRTRLIYQVQVRALKPGSYRFEAKVNSREIKEPIIIQESTTVYDPQTGAINGSAQMAPEPSKIAGELPVSLEPKVAESAGDAATSPASPAAPTNAGKGLNEVDRFETPPSPLPSAKVDGHTVPILPVNDTITLKVIETDG